MSYFADRLFNSFMACALAGVLGSSPVLAAMNPAFEIDPKALEQPVAARPATAPRKQNRPVRVAHAKATAKAYHGGRVQHTVRPGDNLLKILIYDYGLSRREAEACLDEIRRENNINDIKRLKIGQKITILLGNRGAGKGGDSGRVAPEREKGATAYQAFRLAAPADAQTEQQNVTAITELWKTVVPPQAGKSHEPLSFQSAAFSLTLDPRRYPVLDTADGGKILLDRHGALPPLVRTLIAERDPSIRIVSEPPADARRFMAAMLNSAGFYSVEHDFVLDFGADPRLRVRSDFKVEKTADSIVKQDVLLINCDKTPYPQHLTEFLRKEGFTTLEPFASPRRGKPSGETGQLYQIAPRDRMETVDALLSSLSVTCDANHQVNVFSKEDNGISLSVNAQRYLERNGQRIVVAAFAGDAVTYTLYRILETRGYRVVILDDKDNFRKISEKLLTALGVPGQYETQVIRPRPDSAYSLQLSGFKIDGPSGSAPFFITDRSLDSPVRDLLGDDGFKVLIK